MARERRRLFTIAGRVWRWCYRPMRAYWGLCDYGSRTITIDPRHEDGRLRLDTELHEALHALQAFATEEHTAEVATTLAAIMWGLGYRLTEPAGERVYTGD